jgi:heme/copper-type cytochrome/quinol oxidase subunit 2
MRNVFSSILAFLLSIGTGAALAVIEEGSQAAPEPTVAVGWVYFFLLVFVGVCVWFGYAIWNADKKNRAADTPSRGQQN